MGNRIFKTVMCLAICIGTSPLWGGVPINTFSGKWVNTDPNTSGITTVSIQINSADVMVQAWGKCHPQDCDWGKVKARAYGKSVTDDVKKNTEAIVAEFNTSGIHSILMIRMNGSSLSVQFFTNFTDNRAPYTGVYSFKKASDEDCIAFDYQKAEAKKVGDRWKITVGNMLLLDFASSETEAKQALSIIKHYKMTSQCFVGRPDPSLEYYLVGGNAPVGAKQGEDCVSFDPAKIAVKQVSGSWKIVEGDHWILDFASNKAEADESFKIIKKYGFKYICFVGRPGASMTYFRK